MLDCIHKSHWVVRGVFGSMGQVANSNVDRKGLTNEKGAMVGESQQEISVRRGNVSDSISRMEWDRLTSEYSSQPRNFGSTLTPKNICAPVTGAYGV